MFPESEVRAEQTEKRCGNTGQLEVSISSEGMEIVSVPQRDLFAKYDWPAEERIIECLEKFKDEGKDYVAPPLEEDDWW